MRRPVWFVDTSIFLNLLDVPGFSQDRERVVDDFRAKQKSGSLILPVAAVIETGNHVAQLKNGLARREAARKFGDALLLVSDGRAPWELNSSKWDDDFLHRLVSGGMTGLTLVEHAIRGVGCGDLSILVEREIYRERTGLSDVRIWTLDAKLAAHS